MINTYDIDGVINLGDYVGVYPGPEDIIITGRSIIEYNETTQFLHERGIFNKVFFNPTPYEMKTRVSSGTHKGKTILYLIESLGIKHGVHFEDDEIQIEEIKRIVPSVRIVHVVSDLVSKENQRHFI